MLKWTADMPESRDGLQTLLLLISELTHSVQGEIALLAPDVTGVTENPTELLLIWHRVCTTLIVDAFFTQYAYR
jgi:hypothetical protein